MAVKRKPIEVMIWMVGGVIAVGMLIALVSVTGSEYTRTQVNTPTPTPTPTPTDARQARADAADEQRDDDVEACEEEKDECDSDSGDAYIFCTQFDDVVCAKLLYSLSVECGEIKDDCIRDANSDYFETLYGPGARTD